MLTEPTLDRLRALRLGAMADAYRTQLQDPAIGALSFDERVGLLVEAEHLSRDNRKLARRLKEAKLRMPQACLEDLDYAPRRELDRALIRQLATGRWIAEHQQRPHHRRHRRREDVRRRARSANTRVGRATARSIGACRGFFQELALARADGSYTTLLARLARVDVLVLDDWGLAAVTDVQRQDLLEVMEDRDADPLDDHHQPAAARSVARRIWATRRSPTRSSIASSTEPTRFRSWGRHDGKIPRRRRNLRTTERSDGRLITTTAQEASGTTIGKPAGVQHPWIPGLARATDQDGCGNGVPMETQERFPQGLGNLAQTARFPHSHKPITLWSETRRQDRNTDVVV